MRYFCRLQVGFKKGTFIKTEDIFAPFSLFWASLDAENAVVYTTLISLELGRLQCEAERIKTTRTINKCNAGVVLSRKNCYKCSMTLRFENLASTLSCSLNLRPVSWAWTSRRFSSKFLSQFCRLPCPCLLQIYGIPPISFRLFHGRPSCGISVHQYLGDTQVSCTITTWPARSSLLCQYDVTKCFVGIPGPSLHWFCDV